MERILFLTLLSFDTSKYCIFYKRQNESSVICDMHDLHWKTGRQAARLI